MSEVDPLVTTTPVVIALPGQKPVTLVPAADYIRVEDERNKYRRALAMVNGWRTEPPHDFNRLDQIIRNAGMTWDEGRSVQGIIRWSQEARLTRQAAPTKQGKADA
jgi:hypothetical protein